MQQFSKIFALGLAAVLTLACASKSDVVEGTPSISFDEVQGKVWVLDTVKTESGDIAINRRILEANGTGDDFSLFIDNERISGKGAPNRYFAPYTLGKDQEISISPIAGTLMMSFVEPEGLQERDYYSYLEKVSQWDLSAQDTLELFTETPEGDPVVLVFTYKEK
ncbi:putative lipoprotein [Treponema primitia ZAS-2]|uniref:Putative lipoprotein n=1 Tax=Treponema primitia (strain ATCC BAA-887 / DSM 12427 / ZAS-2) TaxID=545694 RepID=F5YNW6_TREPZ|nr:META domain-containing protein [Treponema primitia]AEF83570.1 putative lipoprotein [Treponema primitia ZAS-2]